MLRGALCYISNPNASFFSKEGSADQLNSKWIALRECFRIKDCILEAYNSSNEDRYDFIIDINVIIIILRVLVFNPYRVPSCTSK